MRRTGVLVVTAALGLTVAACGADGDPPAADGSSADLASSLAPLLEAVPAGLVVPETFDTTAGFALRTGAGAVKRGEDGRDTYEVTPFGVASYAIDDAGVPIIESVSMTGTGQWRLEVSDPLQPDTEIKPSLVSVVGEETTWLGLVEHGTETGTSKPVTRVSTYDARTGAVGGRATVDGVDRMETHLGSNIVLYVDSDQGWGTVVIDPATGTATRHDPVTVREGEYEWTETVFDVYRGKELALRQCTDESFFSSCPSGLLYGGQWVPGGESYLGLVVTPGGATVGHVDVATGKDLGGCSGEPIDVAPWSPSGRYAVIAGNVVDFTDHTAVCLGFYPIVTAIDDQGVGYGSAENGDRVRIDTANGGQITTMPADTVLPRAIGAGGYGIFRTDTSVVVLPPR
ncbi:hypothetical protein SAMN05661080_04124 [Modestobacter sp. DSM 44400]|uniref:hypothetical protein n=1 Tax=Modestobacter sp. DSM 44400 TaxID=1550230 RepID=UPI0008984994|nr:hypothetical protein [Modestobacter sp. DSM 44400]SDY63760.1 hypothetical protein SAMN05661080_04124 [Modestobacter sp. DSM 44400]